jgi:hypothetical protein
MNRLFQNLWFARMRGFFTRRFTSALGAAVFQYCSCLIIVVAALATSALNLASTQQSSRRQASILVPKTSVRSRFRFEQGR